MVKLTKDEYAVLKRFEKVSIQADQSKRMERVRELAKELATYALSNVEISDIRDSAICDLLSVVAKFNSCIAYENRPFN